MPTDANTTADHDARGIFAGRSVAGSFPNIHFRLGQTETRTAVNHDATPLGRMSLTGTT